MNALKYMNVRSSTLNENRTKLDLRVVLHKLKQDNGLFILKKRQELCRSIQVREAR